jgi:glycosyltransferase involved in cell wall biosynthesis
MKVSVSITAYEHERYLTRALGGVLAQEAGFDWEVVLGEDCSRDRTREIALDFARRYPERVRTVLPERNLGAGGKRLFAATLALCRGEYVAMMDGDDYWTAPHKLRAQAAFLDAHPECSMCFHDALVVHEDGSRPAERMNGPGQKPRSAMADVLASCFVASCSPMIRREVLAELPDWYFEVAWGDWPLYVLAAERGSIGYLDEVMGVWWIHGGGMWSRLGRVEAVEGVIDFYRRIDAALGGRHRRLIRPAMARCWADLALLHGREGDGARARACALRALRCQPRGGGGVPTGQLLALLAKPYTRGARRAWRGLRQRLAGRPA